MVLEKALESPLDCNKVQQVHTKGDQSWVFIGRTDAEAELKKKKHYEVLYSSILAWRIPWTEEPGRLQSTGSQRVRHD